jgi:hypothetical protein
MRNYRLYAVIPLFIMFLYIGYLRYKNLREYQKETGINFHSFRDTFNLFFDPPQSEAYRSAFNKMHKKKLKLSIIFHRSFDIYHCTICYIDRP